MKLITCSEGLTITILSAIRPVFQTQAILKMTKTKSTYSVDIQYLCLTHAQMRDIEELKGTFLTKGSSRNFFKNVTA